MTHPQGYPSDAGQGHPGQHLPPGAGIPPPGQGGWHQPPQPTGYGPAPTGYGPPQQYGPGPGGYPPQQYGPGPGGYPPQQYGPGPGGYPQQFLPPAKKKSKVGLIVTLVLVGVLVLVGGGVGLVVYLAGQGTPGGTPTQSVEAFLTAAYTNNDTAGAEKWVASDNLSTVKAAIEKGRKPASGSSTSGPKWSDLKERVQGNVAAVAASVEWPGASGGVGKPVGLWAFALKVEDGEWKISEFHA